MAEETGVGAHLCRRREERGSSVEDVAAATRILPRVLRELEEERLDRRERLLPPRPVVSWEPLQASIGGSPGSVLPPRSSDTDPTPEALPTPGPPGPVAPDETDPPEWGP